MALKSEILLLSGQMLSLKPPRPHEWHLDSGWDYICVAVWIVTCCQARRSDFQEEQEPVFLDTIQEVPPVQQNALPISSALQKGNSGKHDFPLKVFTVVFGWFVLVLWVITDNNSTAGNLITQVALPHFVWVKSIFSSLWVQLILTKRGAVCNHTSFPHPTCQVDLCAFGIVQNSPLCLITGMHLLVCPYHIILLSLLISNSIPHSEDYFTSELASLNHIR